MNPREIIDRACQMCGMGPDEIEIVILPSWVRWQNGMVIDMGNKFRYARTLFAVGLDILLFLALVVALTHPISPPIRFASFLVLVVYVPYGSDIWVLLPMARQKRRYLIVVGNFPDPDLKRSVIIHEFVHCLHIHEGRVHPFLEEQVTNMEAGYLFFRIFGKAPIFKATPMLIAGDIIRLNEMLTSVIGFRNREQPKEV